MCLCVCVFIYVFCLVHYQMFHSDLFWMFQIQTFNWFCFFRLHLILIFGSYLVHMLCILKIYRWFLSSTIFSVVFVRIDDGLNIKMEHTHNIYNDSTFFLGSGCERIQTSICLHCSYWAVKNIYESQFFTVAVHLIFFFLKGENK